MRLILVMLLVAILAIPAAAVGGQTVSSSSQAAASQGATKASADKKGKKGKKRKHQSRRARQQARAGTTQASSSSATDDEVEVKGRIVSLSPLTVGATTCVVPTGFSLAGFAVGDRVEMTCDLIGGQWVLRKIHREDAVRDAARGKVEVKGIVTSLGPLTVSGITCVVPAGMSLAGIAVGDFVEMKCRLKEGQWVATRIEHEDDDDDDDHSGPGSGDDDDDDDDHDDDDNSGPGGGDDD